MDPALKELILLIPPLENPEGTDVNWAGLEERVGLSYPQHFKEFVSVYGSCVWFGSWNVFFETAKDNEQIEEFMQTMSETVSSMRDRGMFKWEHGERLSLPLYPDDGGLLPFLIDFDNNCVYSWNTTNSDPEKWPVTCWVDRQITELRGITIAGMFLEWLHRSSRMRKVWGDVRDVEDSRIRLYRG